MKFIDVAEIHVKAGDGGAGCTSFRREKYVPKGGPDGGDGGWGADVRIRANRQLNTLLDYQYRREYHAPRGEHGKGANKTGRSGDPLILMVPVGTVIREAESNAVLADLVHDEEETVVARGGRGGRGNAAFATATHQAPREWEPGGSGEERLIRLELKLLADVGLVGLPNVGKSTLISVISSAKPKIADYPFTTLVPNLGIVRVGEGKGFVVADIPGIIEGAHVGKGLGIQFLRHIERTKVLVFLIEATNEAPTESYRMLLNELSLFNKALVHKPRIVALTKVDLVDPRDRRAIGRVSFPKFKTRGKPEVPSFPISAVTGEGVQLLVRAMWSAVEGVPRRVRSMQRV